MIPFQKTSLSPYVAIGLVAVSLHAVELEKIEVEADRLITPTMQANETVYTGSEVTQKGMELQGTKATTNVYEAIGLLPGISVETPDSSGLAIEQSSVRVRGVKSSMGALSVEGVPNYGGNPIGPRDYLYDMENMESISVYKGGVPADIGTGVGSRGGAITLHPRWAEKEFGFDVTQSIGSNDYTKSYFRLDSGILNESGTRFSGSLSYAEADKFRGEGELGSRANGNVSLVQPLGDKATIKLWYNHNDQEQHLYRPLTYSQISNGNLSSNYKTDYNSALSGVASKDIYYYDYNKGTYKNDDFLSVITYHIDDTFALNLKPYYSSEDTQIDQGVTSNGGRIQKRTRDIERYGILSEIEATFGDIKTVLGYHYENSSMDISTQNYAITSSGLSYRGYGVVGTSGTTYINTPYMKVSGKQGDFNWQGGVKYFKFEDSDSLGYTTNSTTYALERASDLDRDATDYTIVLPTLGASYDLDEAWQLYASYGKNFIRPYSYMPLMNTYNTYRTQFQAAGVSAQDLFDGYGIEKSDNFDLGIRYKADLFEISPTLFYGKHKDLLTTISDSRVLSGGKPINYQQNIGKATSYGLETEINVYMSDSLTLFVNPTYSHFTYDEDITYLGATMATKDNQIVDTPKWMARTGLIYKVGPFEIIPTARYLGERYGDATNNNKVDACWLFDGQIVYTQKNFYDKAKLKVALEINNIFNKEYVSVINASDDTMDGAASYYQGAPRTIMLTMGVHF